MQLHEFERGLSGRIALVTGAAIGNGKAFCERLAQEGATVVIADIVEASETADIVRAAGQECMTLVVDVTNEEDCRKMVAQIIEKYGRIDILVHNVGMYDEEPFELIKFEQWNKMITLNLHSLFCTTQAVLPVMKQAGFGRIITLSSDTVWLGTPYLVHYITTKMGIIGFTRSLAAEIGNYGITINTITVGLTATQKPQGERVSKSMLEHILPAQTVRRSDEPEDIANVVAFLALPASGIINGQTINVDGGVARH